MSSEENSQEKIESLGAALEKMAMAEEERWLESREGIIGYIYRDSTSASVELRDPSKTIEYAVLSATARECGEYLANTFNLGDVKTVVLEGGDIKMLLLIFGNHRLSIFMEKNVDHTQYTIT